MKQAYPNSTNVCFRRWYSRNEPLDGSLIPNIWLTVGIWTSLAGGMIALMGDYERAQQPPPRVPVE